MSMNPREVLQTFEVTGRSDWFMIGYGESRVTVYTQQVRALNLAWALKEDRLKSGPVVVIGGGAAGLSAAAALAHFGASVTVLERESHVLPLQRNCYKRHLHPHIFDWPNKEAENARADLPLLNWKAGMAHEVALSIESAFEELVHEYGGNERGRLRLRTGVSNVELDIPGRGQIIFRRGRARECLPYGTLIFALGFGVENSFWDGPRGSYWADNSLDQHGVFPPGRYLISGTGDGGLIDLLRIVLTNFRQDELARLIENTAKFSALRERILAIDDESQKAGEAILPSLGRDAAQQREGKILYESYASLESLLQDLDQRLEARLNPDVRVTLLSRSASPFSLTSRPLHRLLLSRIMFRFAHLIDVRCNVDLKEPMLRRERNQVVFTHGKEEIFDHVVVRHGSMSTVQQFPALHEAMKNARPRGRHTDPLYTEAFLPRIGPIAWSSGPHEQDYLDELKVKVSSVASWNKPTAPIDNFEDLFVEIREEQQPESAPTAYNQSEGEDDRGTLEERDNKRRGEALRELEMLHTKRFQNDAGGAAVQASNHGFRGLTFLRGRMGTGKSTFLKVAAHAALKAHRLDPNKPFPVFVNKDPEIAGASTHEVPAALADAALRSVEMATYSRAASYLRLKMSRADAILFLDTVDGWSDESLHTVARWVQEKNVCALVAARRFPFDPAKKLLGRISVYEILGIPPTSARPFLEGHFEGIDGTRVLDALKRVPNADEWRRNPFLLALVGRLVQKGLALDELTSTLELFKSQIQGAIDRIADGEGEPIEATLKRIAREDLRGAPARFFFPRARIPLRDRDKVLATNLVSGGQTLEFAHLSIGEYLAAQMPIDLAGERRRLLEPDITWQHHLEVLAMGHARSAEDLERAFEEAQTEDIEHRRLMLVLRAIAYGGSQVTRFCADRGNEVVSEVLRRLALPSGRFGDAERALMRATERASPFLKGATVDTRHVPQDGEPGAEGWALSVSLGRAAGERPVGSHWWVTIFHQARALLGCDPDEVRRRTRGGEFWERIDAMEALAEDSELASLLTDRYERVRQEGLERCQLSVSSARRLGMLADEESWVRLRALQNQPDGFWATSSAQSVLESIVIHDPSALVRWWALGLLKSGRLLPELLQQLRELTQPRERIKGDESQLLTGLMERFAKEPAANDIINTFISSGNGWFCRPEVYEKLCQDATRAEILKKRLESDNPYFDEIHGAKGIPQCVEALRGIVGRFLNDPSQYFRLAAAIESLPPNDEASRPHRLACLDPTHIPGEDKEAESKRVSILCAAITSFAQDAEAVGLLRRFLEQTKNAGPAVAALCAIGRTTELRDLVWRQLKEGQDNARIEAVRILGEDLTEHRKLRSYLSEMPRAAEVHERMSNQYLQAAIVEAVGKGSDTTEWLLGYIDDTSDPVREIAIKLLIDRPEAQESLMRQVSKEKSSGAKRRLWKKFAEDPNVRDELRIRAQEDHPAIRQAYYSLLSQDEARLGALREYFRDCHTRGEDADALAEMIHPLARDGEALPDLRALIESNDIKVRATLLHALRTDDKLRAEAHKLLEKPEWVSRFSFNAPSAFRRYFEDDPKAKDVLFAQIQGGTLNRALDVVLPLMRGYAPATSLLREHALDKASYNHYGACAALIDHHDIYEKTVRELHSKDNWERRRAADLLDNVPDAQEALADLIGDSEKDIRRIAYRARARLGIPFSDLKTLLQEEEEGALRTFLVNTVSAPPNEETKGALRERVASDPAAGVRIQAASRLPRAEPKNPLGTHESLRAAVAASSRSGDALATFLRAPRQLVRDKEVELFDQVLAWTVAKLASTLPTPAPIPDVTPFVDAPDALFGELRDIDLSAENIYIRLAMDSSELPRNRNIWPAANTVLAWSVAYHLVTNQPRTVLLACADVSFDDLSFPKLDPGTLRLGPTFFGFRLAESGSDAPLVQADPSS